MGLDITGFRLFGSSGGCSEMKWACVDVHWAFDEVKKVSCYWSSAELFYWSCVVLGCWVPRVTRLALRLIFGSVIAVQPQGNAIFLSSGLICGISRRLR